MNTIRDYPNIEVDKGLNNNTHIYLLNNIRLRVGLDSYPTNQQVKMYAGPGCNSYPGLVRFIKVKDNIINMIKELENHNLENLELDNLELDNHNLDNLALDNYIGVHFRNTDIKNNIEHLIIEIKKHSNYTNIYLATDDYKAYEQLKLALPNHNIYQYTKPINANGKPIHYNNDNKYILILNTLIDIYFLNKSTIFIPSIQSSISRLINYMRETKQSIYG
jgi:hypothetical protein